jgi:hypothetical protein
MTRLGRSTAVQKQGESLYAAEKNEFTSSFNALIIHSPPLLEGLSWMTPTSANSEHTRRMGRCRATRTVSSFSRCSGPIADSEARFGALMAKDMADTKAGVKVLRNR